MRWNSLGVSVVLALVIAACSGSGGESLDPEPDEAVLQITSEGGFAPVEVILNNGPRYTLLGDATLLFQGVTTLEFPGQLVPPYFTAQLSDSQMNAVLAMVEDIGLPEIDDETDDRANQFVADATTEVIRYWDETGEHRYAVYALGLDEASSDRNNAFLELIETLDRFTAENPGEPYEPEQVRVIAGVGFVDPEFEDVREWPLDSTDLSTWEELPNGWHCTTFDASVLVPFEDATQATTWEHPENEPLKLLVRPLLPGEPSCP